MRTLVVLSLCVSLAALASLPASQLGGQLGGKKTDWFKKSVKKLESRFEPAEAKPGQTVRWLLELELNEGFTTYPFAQPDPNAEFMINQISFPESGPAVFVGKTIDPPKFLKKAEPEINIKELRYYQGKVVFERKVVIHPEAKPGLVAIEIPALKLSVCDASNCYPLKAQKPVAKLKVLDGPPVAVDPAYVKEVEKAKP